MSFRHSGLCRRFLQMLAQYVTGMFWLASLRLSEATWIRLGFENDDRDAQDLKVINAPEAALAAPRLLASASCPTHRCTVLCLLSLHLMLLVTFPSPKDKQGKTRDVFMSSSGRVRGSSNATNRSQISRNISTRFSPSSSQKQRDMAEIIVLSIFSFLGFPINPPSYTFSGSPLISLHEAKLSMH